MRVDVKMYEIIEHQVSLVTQRVNRNCHTSPLQ